MQMQCESVQFVYPQKTTKQIGKTQVSKRNVTDASRIVTNPYHIWTNAQETFRKALANDN